MTQFGGRDGMPDLGQTPVAAGEPDEWQRFQILATQESIESGAMLPTVGQHRDQNGNAGRILSLFRLATFFFGDNRRRR